MSWRKTIPLLLLFVSASLYGGTPAVLVVGDSLSAGYGLSAEETWPRLLQKMLQQRDLAFRVVNASISGDTTSGGLARLPRALKIHEPAVVIIELGGNDGLRAVPIAEVRRNLDRMIELSQDAGAKVLLTSILIPPNYGPDYSEKFARVFGEAAAEGGAALAPFFLEGIALEPGMMQADGIHPTAAAQPRIVANLWPSLCPLLVGEQLSRC